MKRIDKLSLHIFSLYLELFMVIRIFTYFRVDIGLGVLSGNAELRPEIRLTTVLIHIYYHATGNDTGCYKLWIVSSLWRLTNHNLHDPAFLYLSNFENFKITFQTHYSKSLLTVTRQSHVCYKLFIFGVYFLTRNFFFHF